MSLSIRLAVDPVRTLAYSAMGAAYMGIGSAMTRPVRMLYISNITDVALMFSFDGVEDHLLLPSNGYLMLDITANKSLQEGYYLADGDRIYVKNVGTPSTGSVYVTAFCSTQ